MTSRNRRAFVGILVCVLSTGCAAAAMQSAPLERNGGHKSYVLPAIEIVAMDAALNLANHNSDPVSYDVTTDSIRRNLRGPWVVDDDPFQINQFAHPYQGAMYHGIARSNGLGYWPAAAYTFAGSVLWEIAGETTTPSKNDQIASGIAGSFLGEPLYRISRLLVDGHGPGVWRTLGSILASPPTGLNHLMVGSPAGSHTPDVAAVSDVRVQFGATAAVGGPRSQSPSALNQAHLALSMDYGNPGNTGYRHERPFDYFRIESSLSTDGLDYLSTRGLIAGKDYNTGHIAGIWGLYGSYDYFSPDDFRLSTTALSFGTTLQRPLSESLVVQSTALLGAGYAATSPVARTEKDYHYGVAPQAVVNLRLIGGRRVSLDVTGREYFVSGRGGFDTGQQDLIFVGDTSFAIRVYRRNGVGLTYQLAGRNSTYLDLPDKSRSSARVGVFYTFLGSGGFGAVRP